MIKLFASDLDGTLFNALHEADRTIVHHLVHALDAGAHVALSTGRCVRSGQDLGFGELPLDVVCANGAFVIDAAGQVLRSVALDPATLEEMLATFPEVCFNCIALDACYVRGSEAQHAAGYLAPHGLLGQIVVRRLKKGGLRGNPEPLFDQTDAMVMGRAGTICKVNCRVPDAGQRRELEAFVASHADTLVNASFDGDLFELTAAGVDKGEAVAFLARHFGIVEDEVAVYGDGGNDLAMLERFVHAYAPKNASAAAKEAAGHVIGSNAFHAVSRHIAATVRRERSARP